MFTGTLFVCKACGYTEFFDDDPSTTERNETMVVDIVEPQP